MAHRPDHRRVSDVDEGIARAVQAEHGFGHTACMWSKNIENLQTKQCDDFVEVYFHKIIYARLRFFIVVHYYQKLKMTHKFGPVSNSVKSGMCISFRCS